PFLSFFFAAWSLTFRTGTGPNQTEGGRWRRSQKNVQQMLSGQHPTVHSRRLTKNKCDLMMLHEHVPE
ncbi:hypothetical protein, partial [Bilophila wadsworthia]|uniref:hypothetical protein n=1 Tax=Bilophila wadsworthia TaxID=35833 RepID=UPI003AB2AB44